MTDTEQRAMTNRPVISPAFKPFLADSGPNDKRDAIVIYQTPPVEGPPVRGRLRVLKQRMAAIKAQAKAQESVQSKLFHDYRKESNKRLPGKPNLEASPIGENALPV